MKETKEVVACVCDHSLFGVPIAKRLAQGMKKLYVFSEWEEGFSTVNKAIVGDGFEDITRCHDIWEIKDEVDLFVFPDVQRAGLQLELESQGKAVWGSRRGDLFELDREVFLSALEDEGLDVPPHEAIKGLNRLRGFLKDKEDYYIKVSLFRGSFETCHFRSWKLDEGLLDLFAVRLGPCKELLTFLCFPNIETPLEIGGDTYVVDGQWPNLQLHGVEWKDRSYLGAVTKHEDMPKQLRQVMNTFGPLLGKHRYRNQWSMEVRVKGQESYFIDATCRMGLPSTASQLELWENWPDIVWHGANGQLIQPKASGKYSAEAIVTMKGDPQEWRTVEVPKELGRWLKCGDCFEHDGLLVFPASDTPGGDDVGWLVAIGDTPEETIRNINRNADALPDGMDANVECLTYVIKEIHEAAKSGIKFGYLPVPSPAVVVQS